MHESNLPTWAQEAWERATQALLYHLPPRPILYNCIRTDIFCLCAALAEMKQELDTMQAERDRWRMDWETASAELLNERSRIVKAEATLAKAIEALKWYVEGEEASSWLAADVLAEIKGERSETTERK